MGQVLWPQTIWWKINLGNLSLVDGLSIVNGAFAGQRALYCGWAHVMRPYVITLIRRISGYNPTLL
jgi:hypothetical protein